MAKVNILRRQRDFDRLFESGKRYYDKLLVTVVCLRPESDQARVAFIVGRKVDKRAVVRNRVKRRLREAWRRQVPQPSVGADIAFVARPEAAAAGYWDLADVMRRHIAQTSICGEDSHGGELLAQR